MKPIVFCHQCRYWEQLGEMGLCRRRAPRGRLDVRLAELLTRITVEEAENLRAYWPETSANDWCGEGKS